MIISGLTTRRLWIGGFFITVYLAAAITLFFMISEHVSALGSRSLVTILALLLLGQILSLIHI